MAVKTPTRAAGGDQPTAVDAGVIDDARRRQQRRRRGAVVVLLGLVASAAAIEYGARANGDPGRATVPAPGVATGALRAITLSRVEFRLTPTLGPGISALDVSTERGPGPGDWSIGPINYVGAARPISVVAGIPPYSAVLPPRDDPDVILLVAPNVAAVRVGKLGSIGAISVPGLPSGDRIVAYAVPQSATTTTRPRAPIALTAINRRGRPLPTLIHQNLRIQSWSSRGGACAITSTIPALTRRWTTALRRVLALPATTPGLFVSCLEADYAYHGTNLTVAVLLDAHHPGRVLAPLWNTQPLANQPGILTTNALPHSTRQGNSATPIYARRIGDAWLALQTQPGPAPTTATRIKLLKAIHITKLDPDP